jgi:hypothetical protein
MKYRSDHRFSQFSDLFRNLVDEQEIDTEKMCVEAVLVNNSSERLVVLLRKSAETIVVRQYEFVNHLAKTF